MNRLILSRKKSKGKPLPECLKRTIILSYKDGVPVVACAEVKKSYVFFCERCGHEHYHGAAEGPRSAHCSAVPYVSFGRINKRCKGDPNGPDFRERGYILKKV